MSAIRRTTVEVSTIWSETALDVRQLQGSDRKAKVFRVGEDPRCDCWVQPEELGGRSQLNLIEVRGDDVTVRAPKGSSVILSSPELTISERDKLTQLGLLRPAAGESDVMELALKSGWIAEVGLGEVAFRAQRITPPALPKGGPVINWDSLRWTGISLAIHALFLALAFAVPPTPNSISWETTVAGDRFAQYLIAPAEPEPMEPSSWIQQQEEPQPADQGGDQGESHAGDSGQMGAQDAPNQNRRHAIRNNGLDREQLRQEMIRPIGTGIVSVLNSHALTSPFASGMENGPDPENAVGHLMGEAIGDAFGYQGMGPVGTGRGGGGHGEGTIGIGDLGRICRGNCAGQRFGENSRIARLPTHRDRVPRGPAVSIGEAVGVGDGLPRDVIRRQIRLRRAQFSHCYEQELIRRPDLAGRVMIRFIIGQQGQVISSNVAENSMDGSTVGQCVAQVVHRISFPAPRQGVVVVNYPFTFMRGE
jgi:hypothetical protein